VQGEMDKAKTDTASLVQTAGLLNDVRSYVSAADGFLRDGKVAEAEAQYSLALGVIPEISRSYSYFTTRNGEAETARQAALRAGLVHAETAFAAGRYPEMLAAYRDALSYLPESAARVAATVSNIGAAGAAQTAQRFQTDQAQAAADSQKTRADQDQAVSAALAHADGLLAQRQYADAITQYLAVLQDYPQSPRKVSAVKGIHDGVAAVSLQAASDLKTQADQVAALKAQLESVQTDLSGRTADITGIKKSLMGLVRMNGDPAATPTDTLMETVNQKFGDLASATGASSDLQKSLEAATKRSSDLAAQVSRLSSENSRLAADLGATRQDAERQRLLAAQAAEALKNAQASAAVGGQAGSRTTAAGTAPGATGGISEADARAFSEFQGLVAGYLAYTRQEDANLAQYGPRKALMLSIGGRDSVLASMGKFFDGLLGRVKRYEAQSTTDGIDTGRKAALDDVISLMTNLANQKTVDAQRSFLDARLSAEKDPRMKSLIGALARFMTSR
jgi:tetratricopeptide (TPR) repeat protein